MKHKFWGLILWILVALPIYSSSLLFSTLKDGIGIRPLSMGGSYTALGEEAVGIVYNPAELSLKGTGYHYENFDNNASQYSSFFAHSFLLSPFGFTYWKKADLSNNAVEVSAYGFGKKGSNGIDWGITYKTVKESYTDTSSSGWSSDLGILAHINPNMNVGITAHDIMKQNVAVPATLATGIAVFTSSRDFIFTSDLVFGKENDRSAIAPHFGAEYLLTEGLVLRGGWTQDALSGGASLILPFAELEYGAIYPNDATLSPSYMLGVQFGKQSVAKEQKRKYTLFKPKAYAEFAIGSNLVEGKSSISLLGGTKIGSNDLLSLIHEAMEDPSCEGFVVKIGSVADSLGAIGLVQEIRSELQKAKLKGKKVIAYLENWATLPEYYLATVADRIVMPELGTISHLGLDIELVKTKTFLQNFGIEPVIITSGKYKASLSPESDPLNPNSRQVLEGLIQNMYHQVLFDIKESRHLSWEHVSDVFDGRLISAKEAREKGLVDTLGYWDQVQDSTAEFLPPKSPKPPIVSLTEFSKDPDPVTLFPVLNQIAILEVDGVIVTGKSRPNFLYGASGCGAEDIEAAVESIKKDFTIRGVIVRINSPGGSILASDQIYTALGKLKEAGKLVYVSMGNIAASGGYYIALNADKIIANPGTLTGSIGVISAFQNKEGLHDLLGVERQVVKTGEYMDMFSPNKHVSKKEKAMMQRFQDEQYRLFVDKVIKHRKLTDQEAKDLAQGQVFTGEQALKLKMIDKLGNFYDAVSDMCREIQLNTEPQLVFYRPQTSMMPGFF